ncbi:MAG: cysteine desulfurase-like protein [Planctomycetota bacterium]|nr:cysteine desulfurase-like protein [Planctomycetota bacterium]
MEMNIAQEREWVGHLRRQFPALQREQSGSPVVYLDGPAGTQVPQSVIHSVSQYMAHHNANLGGTFSTSRECTDLMVEAARGFSDFFGTTDPQEIIFGPNATSLTLALSRAISRTWNAGDEIIVTDLDHDANITPWVLAARDQGVTVRHVQVNLQDCTLDLNDLRQKLNARTRLVALGGASNSVGTKNPVARIAPWVHDVNAQLFVDAVHFAPHTLLDVAALGCDYLVCSAYKFFGPHVGILWGKREILDSVEPYKVRPATNRLPGKWMTGTQNHPCIAGALAAIDYLAQLGRQLSQPTVTRRAALKEAFRWIEDYERRLMRRLLDGLATLPSYTVFGIRDPARDAERLPTLSLRHRSASPQALAQYLADHGVFAWHGNYYALRLSEILGQEPDGMVRLGLVHYNTPEEVDRTLSLLQEFG